MKNIKKLIEIIEREELLAPSFPILVEAKKELAAQSAPSVKDVEGLAVEANRKGWSHLMPLPNAPIKDENSERQAEK